jgi:hypothetical protein
VEIYLYNDATGITKRITEDSIPDISPVVHGGRVAYRHRGADPHIYLYDDSTGETISVANVDAWPHLSDTTVAWIAVEADPATQVNVASVFAYDISTQVTTKFPVWPAQFPTMAINDFVLDGSNLAWSGFDGHDLEVFFYDGQNGSVTQITDNDLDDYWVSLNGLTLTWNANAVSLAKPPNDAEIYVARFVVPEPSSAVVAIIGSVAMLLNGGCRRPRRKSVAA